jgi:hypothetical protein
MWPGSGASRTGTGRSFTPWTAGEARRLLTVAREDRWYAVYAVAVSIGLRGGEALAFAFALVGR